MVISFVTAYDKDINEVKVGTNDFAPFTISVVAKAEPIEEKRSVGVNFEAIVSIGPKAKFQVPGLKADAGGASQGIGYTYAPSISYIPDRNSSNLWNVTLSSPLGLKYHADAGLKDGISVGKIGVGIGVGAELEIPSSKIDEISYNLNMSSLSDRFFFGSQVFVLATKSNPQTMLISNLLRRLSQFSKTSSSVKTGINLGIQSSVSFTFGISGEENNQDAANELGYEIEPDLFSANYEASKEFNADGSSKQEINISASVANNVGVLLGLLPNEVGETGVVPFIFNFGQNTFSTTLSRNLNINDELLDASVSMKNEKDITISGNGYSMVYSNELNYSKNSISKLGSIPLNFVSSYFKNGSFINSPTTLIANSVAGSGSAYKQVKNYQSKVFEKPQGTFNSKEIILKTERELSATTSHSFPFAVQAIVGVAFSVEYEESGTYKYPLKEYQYSTEFSKMLQTVDYPKIESNLQLPVSGPLSTYISNIINEISNVSTNVLNQALSFLTQTSALIGGGGLTTFSNRPYGSIMRLNLNAQPINYISTKTNTVVEPSTFTFNIPGGISAFNTGTNLLFKYYYPENQLQATTATDTLKIITDVFFLNAQNGASNLTIAPNGNFTINKYEQIIN